MRKSTLRYWIIGVAIVALIGAAIAMATYKRLPSYDYDNGEIVLSATLYGNVKLIKSIMETPDDAEDYRYMKDKIEVNSNPKTYWLLNRMMQMYSKVNCNPDTVWAWTIAMNETVNAYDKCIHRNTTGISSCDMAMEDVMQYIDYLLGGANSEMIEGTYICAVASYYQTIAAYCDIVENIQPKQLKELIYAEYSAWFSYHVEYLSYYESLIGGGAYYSDLPNEINMAMAEDLKRDRNRLNIDREILIDSKPFSSAKNLMYQDIRQELNDFKPANSADDVLTTINANFLNWIKTREAVASKLPKVIAESYQNHTADIIVEYLHSSTIDE
jgi:hypothetical protein